MATYRDHRSRHPNPHLSVDGFLKLHLTILRLQLEQALCRHKAEGTLMQFRATAPPGGDGRKRSGAVLKLDKKEEALFQREQVLRAELVVAWQESRAAATLDPIHTIRSVFKLNELESELWLLALARCLDPSFADLFRRLGADDGMVTANLLLALDADLSFTDAHKLLGPSSPLLRYRLLEVDRSRDPSPMLARLWIGADVMARVLNEAARELPHGMTLIEVLPDDPRLHNNAALTVLNRLRAAVQALEIERSGPLVLHCRPSNGPHLWACAVSQQQQRSVLWADVGVCLRQHPEESLDTILRKVTREARFSSNAVVLLDLRSLPTETLTSEAFGRLIASLCADTSPLMLALDARNEAINLPYGVHPRPFVLPEVNGEVRLAMWEHALPAGARSESSSTWTCVAQRGDIDDDRRVKIATLAAELAERRGSQTISPIDVASALRVSDRPELRTLGRNLIETEGWNGLFFGSDTVRGLRGLLSSVRARAGLASSLDTRPERNVLGLQVIFHGPPGTGKSEAAKRIALETGLRFRQEYLLELIASDADETALRVRTLFESLTAEDLLLIDMRSPQLRGDDVATQACLDTIATQIERFDGVLVLEGESELPIDARWIREIHFRLVFTIPDADSRHALWHRMFPQHELLADQLNFEVLAEEFEMGGGMIRRAAEQAALTAATRPNPNNRVNFQDLWEAAVSCYRLLGKHAPEIALRR